LSSSTAGDGQHNGSREICGPEQQVRNNKKENIMTKWHLLAATGLASSLMILNPALAQEAQEEIEQPAAAADVEGDNALDGANIISLPEWNVDEVYAEGISVEELLDAEVVGPTGEEIGDVENVLFGTDGEALSIIAEIGGFVEIGDTHVNVPWGEIEISADGDTIEAPLTQEAIEEYSLFTDPVVGATEAASELQAVEGDNAGVVLTGPRVWRAAELIGDYARLQEGDGWVEYGYVDDLIVRDGMIAAVLVNPDAGWGEPGPYAYPYYGFDYGWYPGLAYYDLPYDREAVGSIEPFDEEALDD
jgi:sporulation protein YlmC with PRC-barrel domain